MYAQQQSLAKSLRMAWATLPTRPPGANDTARAKASRANWSRKRRGAEDPHHFCYIRQLHAHIKAAPSAIVGRFQRLYPWNRGRPDLGVAQSHWKRREVNAYLNGFDAGGYGTFIESGGGDRGAT